MQNETYELIERYFNAETTLEEERRLRQLLAEIPPGDQLADEAKAVMGFSLCAPRRKKARLIPQGIRAWLSAAAAIAIVFTIGLFMPDSHDSTPDMIYASINGHEVTDNNRVMQNCPTWQKRRNMSATASTRSGTPCARLSARHSNN